ncbi:ABC transporter ATP-binding protein [uncultured Psychroserpens sp.]|uniref:ABC transporter ATP-binding protein n=1 Tax=uncultured Psychroserpens sp. TaxID=255436 RepID=UPI00260C8639|nr:ABC transporter ATP-binding protein [uncultured Psychroserpens sp.]
MSDVILKVENISKQYRLGLVGTGTLSDDMKKWWYQIRGKENPFLKVGEVNDRSVQGSSDYVWALQDINFEVQRGEVLGIIGKNGAGKSTLLKLLSRITTPTTGVIKTKGRISSLLEVGTGFHPELTGRENIYLNGAILGMTKSEIRSKEEEIIDFSGCDRYIDTPVKRYSSGMRVRLAFAVAAFLEPDILIVDEVLAVGDIEFQKKAIGKMQDISQGHGRTVLFVSHNMSSVESLCTAGMVLNNGRIGFMGSTQDAVNFYITNRKKSTNNYLEFNDKLNDFVEIHSIGVNKTKDDIFSDEDINIEICLTLLKDTDKRVDVATAIYNESDQLITNVGTGMMKDAVVESVKGVKQCINISIKKPQLNEGIYNILLRVIENRANAPKLKIEEIILFHVKKSIGHNKVYSKVKGFLSPEINCNRIQ